MPKLDIGAKPWTGAMPVVLIGVAAPDGPNFMTAAWISRVNGAPPVLGAALGKRHLTSERIRAEGAFSVNVPTAALVERVDRCGLVSGRNQSKADLFEVFYGELERVPLVAECPVSMECRLERIVELRTNDLFLGEVVATHTEERFTRDGAIDPRAVDPLVLTMPDNTYWSLGPAAGDAWDPSTLREPLRKNR